MNIIQIRLDENKQMGSHGGYYNYEFGLIEKQYIRKFTYADTDDYITVNFGKNECDKRSADDNRKTYSAPKEEINLLIKED